MRKYTTEFLYNVRAIQYVVVQQPELEKVSEQLWTEQIEPAHIYMVCRRPKISVVPELTEFSDEAVVGAFRVWHGAEYEEVRYRVPNRIGRSDLRLEAPWPGTYFEIKTPSDEVVSWGNAAMMVTHFGPRFSRHLNLEVLYVGQSFGFEGSRTAKDRLRSHETLQGIYAEALARSPDFDIWLVLVSFEDPYLMIEIDPTKPAAMTDDEDNVHIGAVLATPVSLQQEVNLTEAILIRYFDPPYNTMFRKSFPNPAHASYRECYELDFHSVSVELDTENINSQLWSAARPASWLHLPQYPLHASEHRESMFGIFN